MVHNLLWQLIAGEGAVHNLIRQLIAGDGAVHNLIRQLIAGDGVVHKLDLRSSLWRCGGTLAAHQAFKSMSLGSNTTFVRMILI